MSEGVVRHKENTPLLSQIQDGSFFIGGGQFIYRLLFPLS
jgi:hypothetical protein